MTLLSMALASEIKYPAYQSEIKWETTLGSDSTYASLLAKMLLPAINDIFR